MPLLSVIFSTSSLAVCLGERDRQSRRWRKGWEENRLKHIRAISRLGPQLQKRSLSSPAGRRFQRARKNVCSYMSKRVCEGKTPNSWPKELSGFHIHASSSRPPVSDLRCSLSHFLPRSHGLASAFPLSSYSIGPRHHSTVCTASALRRWCAIQDRIFFPPLTVKSPRLLVTCFFNFLFYSFYNVSSLLRVEWKSSRCQAGSMYMCICLWLNCVNDG